MPFLTVTSHRDKDIYLTELPGGIRRVPPMQVIQIFYTTNCESPSIPTRKDICWAVILREFEAKGDITAVPSIASFDDAIDGITNAANVGSGAESFKDRIGTIINFRTLLSNSSILTVAQTTDQIELDFAESQIDGDQLTVDFTPTNYTPDTTPPEVDSTDQLTAHLAGIDVELAAIVGGDIEVFFEADWNSDFNNYRTRSINSNGAFRFAFSVPDNFGTLTSIELIAAPSVGAAGSGRNIDLFSTYGAIGESAIQHSENDTTAVYDFTGLTDQWIAIDVSAVFSSLDAGDKCGLQVDHNSLGGAVNYLGIRLIYTPA